MSWRTIFESATAVELQERARAYSFPKVAVGSPQGPVMQDDPLSGRKREQLDRAVRAAQACMEEGCRYRIVLAGHANPQPSPGDGFEIQVARIQ